MVEKEVIGFSAWLDTPAVTVCENWKGVGSAVLRFLSLPC